MSFLSFRQVPTRRGLRQAVGSLACRYSRKVQKGTWSFAVGTAVFVALSTLVIAWIYDLPVRDPDSAVGPAYIWVPVVLLAAFLTDVVPRALWRARNPLRVVTTAR